ncbi:hypothetical protein O3M35_008366 [Rhynocoris fuscipes]
MRKSPRTRGLCEETRADRRYAERGERRKAVKDSSESLSFDFEDSCAPKVHFVSEIDRECPPANPPTTVCEVSPRRKKRARGKPECPPTNDTMEDQRRSRKHYGNYGTPRVNRKRGTPSYMERHRSSNVTHSRKHKKQYGDPNRKSRKRNRSPCSREREEKRTKSKKRSKRSPSKRRRRCCTKGNVVEEPTGDVKESRTSRDYYAMPVCERETRRKGKHRERYVAPSYDESPRSPSRYRRGGQKELSACHAATAEEAEHMRRPQTCSADIMKADWKDDHKPVTTRVSFRDPETKLETIVIISNDDEKTPAKPANKYLGEECNCYTIGEKDIVLKLDNVDNKDSQSNRVQIVPGVFTVQMPNIDGNWIPWKNETKRDFKMDNHDDNFCPVSRVFGQQRDHNFQLSPQFNKLEDKTRKYIPPCPFNFFDETEKYLTKINDLSKKAMENNFTNTFNNNAVINKRKINRRYELEKLTELQPEKMSRKIKQSNKTIFLNKVESKITVKSNEMEEKLKVIGDAKRYLGRGYIKYLAKQFDKQHQDDIKRESLLNKSSKNTPLIRAFNSRKKMYSDSDMNESSSTHLLKYDMSERTRYKNYESNYYDDDNDRFDSLMESSYPKTSHQLERSLDKNEIRSAPNIISSCERTDVSIRKPLPPGMLYYSNDSSSISELAKKSQKSCSKSFWKKVVNNLITNKNLSSKTVTVQTLGK